MRTILMVTMFLAASVAQAVPPPTYAQQECKGRAYAARQAYQDSDAEAIAAEATTTQAYYQALAAYRVAARNGYATTEELQAIHLKIRDGAIKQAYAEERYIESIPPAGQGDIYILSGDTLWAAHDYPGACAYYAAAEPQYSSAKFKCDLAKIWFVGESGDSGAKGDYDMAYVMAQSLPFFP